MSPPREPAASVTVSFVLPAYNEAENLRPMVERILEQSGPGISIDVVVADDHSIDGSFAVLEKLGQKDSRVRAVRLARNSGSHVALRAALCFARGDVVVAMASDGQDPPELLPTLLDAWREGAQVVWAVREGREGSRARDRFFSALYHRGMSRVSSVDLPPSGADFVLLDRRVVDAVVRTPDRNTSLWALITWLGFRQARVPYDKGERLSGESKWTLRAKLQFVIDSLVGFSTLPLRLATGLGFLATAFGMLYAGSLIVNHLTGGALYGTPRVEGWSALMIVLLASTGTILMVLGVLGEYLWRALEEVRGRPLFCAEAEVNLEAATGGPLVPKSARSPDPGEVAAG